MHHHSQWIINDKDNGQNLLGLLSLVGLQGFKQNINTNTDRFEPGGGGVPHPYGQHQNKTIKKRSQGPMDLDVGSEKLARNVLLTNTEKVEQGEGAGPAKNKEKILPG